MEFSQEIDSFIKIDDSFASNAFGFDSELSGDKFKGSVCLTKKICVPDLTFVNVLNETPGGKDCYFQSPVIVYGGVLGLAPSSEFTIRFNKALSLSKDDIAFSFYLGNKDNSFFELGSIDASEIKGTEEEIAWLENLYAPSQWGN